MIFKHAYGGRHARPSGPLSKSLLEHYYNSLFEIVRLSSSKQLKLLAKTLYLHPEYGARVKVLVMDSFSGQRKNLARFQIIIPTLSRLTELSIGRKAHFVIKAIKEAPESDTILPNLTTLGLVGGILQSEFDPSSWLSRIGSLRRVELSRWKGLKDREHDFEAPITSVKEISIDNRGEFEGFAMDPPALLRLFPSASFTDSRVTFPKTYTWSDIVTFMEFVNPETKALHLDASSNFTLLDDPRYTPLDSYLPRFRNLRTLTLVSPLFSNRSPLQLSHLRNLRSLIVDGEAPTIQFVSLLKGPNRLLRLRSLTFSLYPNIAGSTIDEDSSPELAFEGDFASLPDWILPFADESYYLKGSLGLKAILKAAKAPDSNIKMEGNLVGTVKHAWRFVIEVFNRGVARAYHRGDIGILHQATTFAHDNFPSFIPKPTPVVRDSDPKEEWELYRIEWEDERGRMDDCHLLHVRRRKSD